MKTGIELIATERARQKYLPTNGGEGWTDGHDDTHTYGELAIAAACYAVGKCRTHIAVHSSELPIPNSLTWPWESSWYKPSNNRIKELVKAGALLAAEIDRIQRL